jgi:hypothetical protein
MQAAAVYRKFDEKLPDASAAGDHRAPSKEAAPLQPLEQCIAHLPHAGSTDSIVSRLPFPVVKVCHKDTVGLVRLVHLLDEVIPDATSFRFARAGNWRRLLLILVPRVLGAFILRITQALSHVGAQAWAFWATLLAMVLVIIIGGIQSVAWLYKQRASVTERVFVSLAQVQVVWTAQQFVNMIFFATLNLRKFNGSLMPARAFDSFPLPDLLCAGYVRDWSILRLWPLQLFALFSLLWCVYTLCTLLPSAAAHFKQSCLPCIII